LQPLTAWDGLDEAVALVAAQVGPVRLIDNITLRR
jgi:pantothenate synthetase